MDPRFCHADIVIYGLIPEGNALFGRRVQSLLRTLGSSWPGLRVRLVTDGSATAAGLPVTYAGIPVTDYRDWEPLNYSKVTHFVFVTGEEPRSYFHRVLRTSKGGLTVAMVLGLYGRERQLKDIEGGPFHARALSRVGDYIQSAQIQVLTHADEVWVEDREMVAELGGELEIRVVEDVVDEMTRVLKRERDVGLAPFRK